MIYAISDIHGFFEEFSCWLDLLGVPDDFKERGDKLVLLGDYIDYGPDSCRVLQKIYTLYKTMGDALIVLRGNHEVNILEWLKPYSHPNAGEPDESGFVDWNDWLQTDAEADYQTFRGFVNQNQWDFSQRIAPITSELTKNIEAAGMVLANHRELISWLQELPYYYETDRQIFVHAGIDETSPALWRELTESSVLVGKFPASTGAFPKDIIAGYVAASNVTRNRAHEEIFLDGESRYYIDGEIQRTGKLLCLTYNEAEGAYYACLSEDDTAFLLTPTPPAAY